MTTANAAVQDSTSDKALLLTAAFLMSESGIRKARCGDIVANSSSGISVQAAGRLLVGMGLPYGVSAGQKM
jgi:hypothetical protein